MQMKIFMIAILNLGVRGEWGGCVSVDSGNSFGRIMQVSYGCTGPFNNMDGLQQYVHRSMRMLAPRRWNAGSVQLEFRPREIGTQLECLLVHGCRYNAGFVQ